MHKKTRESLQKLTGGNNILYRDLLFSWFQRIIRIIFVNLNTIFSGLLVMYVNLKKMEKNNGKINWIKFYFHRFWRYLLKLNYTFYYIVSLLVSRLLKHIEYQDFFLGILNQTFFPASLQGGSILILRITCALRVKSNC